MTVAVAGAHGKIALLLGPLLAQAGAEVRGIVRNPDHGDDLRAAGMTPAVCDLEGDAPELETILDGCSAVVFAAGAGPGSGDARKQTMDRDGAIKLIAACRRTGVPRYLMVSSMGARDPELPGDGFAAYLRAKAQADAALMASGLDFTIVRPGSLTDDPATGRIRIADRLERGQVPRADVAAVLAAALHTPATVGTAFDLLTGPDPIEDALVAAPAAAA
ncbi:MAG TPA: SDR family oxidoreductase [Solirubrobacteraceae bacterium]|nr:SDR family oxidoreductase [Solirubrobacteraceae bacterium]